jgi:proteic killer suppression protein
VEIIFLNKHVERLYKEGKPNKKYRLSQSLIDKYIERIDFIKAADTVWALKSMRSYNFEKLEGYPNRYSIRLNRQYRLIFNVKWMNEERTIGKFEIDEISKHYE